LLNYFNFQTQIFKEKWIDEGFETKTNSLKSSKAVLQVFFKNSFHTLQQKKMLKCLQLGQQGEISILSYLSVKKSL
jgi:hypothetical protein